MDATAIKRAFEARLGAVNELRSLVEATDGKELSAEDAAKELRLNEAITRFDRDITAALDAAEAEKRADDNRARFAALGLGEGEAKAPEVRSLNAEVRALARGERRSVTLGYEARDLSTTVSGDGAELVPTTLFNQVHEHMVEASPIMGAGIRVLRTAGGESLVIPKTTAYSSAAIVGQGATSPAIQESDPQWTTVTLGAFKYGFMVQVPSELLQDASFDVVSFLIRQGGAALGRGIDADFVTGAGSTNGPNGIDNATVGKLLAADNAITGDELMDAMHSVLAPYRSNAGWLFSDATVALIRKLKLTDGTGATNQYLWQPGLVAGAPDRLLGHPVFIDPNVADLDGTNDAIVGVFGDMSGYYARFAGPVRIERSDDFAFDDDLATFRFLVRADGDIVDTIGIRTIRAAAA